MGAVMQLPQLDAAKLSWQVLSSIGFLGIFGTVIGFVWYYEGVKAIRPVRTAVFNKLLPVFGVGLSALMLGEPILISMVIGGLLVITGVMITNRPRQ